MATFTERFNILFKEFKMKTEYPNGRAAFSRAIGFSKGQVSGWLDGTGTPDPETLKKLSENLNISLLWLIGESDERNWTIKNAPIVAAHAEHDVKALIQFLHHCHGKSVDAILKSYLQSLD